MVAPSAKLYSSGYSEGGYSEPSFLHVSAINQVIYISLMSCIHSKGSWGHACLCRE